METYKGYFLDGDARMIHPSNPRYYPSAHVLKSGPLGSLIEVTLFEVPSFQLDDKVVVGPKNALT